MASRSVENLIMGMFNRFRDRQDRRKQPVTPETAAKDVVLLGHTMPARRGSREGSVPVSLTAEARRRHLYVLGATGTGKTNFLLRLIAGDIACGHSFCVIDLRGDLVERILLHLAANETPETLGDRLLNIDLRDENGVVGFNPLLGPGEVYSRAFHLLSVLRQQAESWGIQLEETLRNSLIALAESGWSLLELEPLLSDADFRAEVLAKVSDSYVKSFFARYGALTEEKQVAWRLPVLNKVTPLLAIPQLRRMFGQRESFGFGPIFDEKPGRIVLISLAVDRLHQAAYLVGGLFVSAFETSIMARANVPEKDRIPVFLYLDEFETMATSNFEAIVAEGRRFGLGLTLSHQNGHQIPVGLRHVLRNNVHTQLYFQTGALDAAELVQEIATKDSRETVRTTLITQGVGEAYLIRRGQPATQVRILPCPDPKVGNKAVLALKAASNARYARSTLEIDTELREREARRAHPGSALPSDSGSPVSPPTFEIRHDKPKGQFKPKSRRTE
jgi:hypothetical protein